MSAPTGRTRHFRGRACPVRKTTKNIVTGAIYDHVDYTRTVINRRDGSTSTETLTRKLRRPGTGVAVMGKEVEIETELTE